MFTNEAGNFTFINVPPDTYTVQIVMSGFKPREAVRRRVSPGDRQEVGVFTIEVGGLTDAVMVKAETPMLQARSGERSFTIPTSAVENLPIANRSFTALASLAPGVTTINGLPTGDPIRIGGGGDTNIMMDGVGVMDTGSNRPLLQMNIESIAEVKVLTSGYQAEYGRSSGLQITAVTKSGTNRFRGSVYDVERDSDWYSNTKVNKLNGNREDGPEGEGLRATRSAAPSASRAATTRCSSSTARNSRRAPPAMTCGGSASRPRSSATVTSRRRPIRTARSTT